MAVRTKQAIRQAFIELLNERPLDKISVKDIAERSTVNRNTFYYYYADIYALVEEIFQTGDAAFHGKAAQLCLVGGGVPRGDRLHV